MSEPRQRGCADARGWIQQIGVGAHYGNRPVVRISRTDLIVFTVNNALALLSLPTTSHCGCHAAEETRVLFITYYELSNDVEFGEIREAGERLVNEGMWPPEGMEIIRWDGAVDSWGVTIAEADDFETVFRARAMWEALAPGMFEEIKTAPAAPVEEIMEEGGALLEELSPPGSER